MRTEKSVPSLVVIPDRHTSHTSHTSHTRSPYNCGRLVPMETTILFQSLRNLHLSVRVRLESLTHTVSSPFPQISQTRAGDDTGLLFKPQIPSDSIETSIFVQLYSYNILNGGFDPNKSTMNDNSRLQCDVCPSLRLGSTFVQTVDQPTIWPTELCNVDEGNIINSYFKLRWNFLNMIVFVLTNPT